MMITKMLISGMMVLQTESIRIKIMINLEKVVIHLVVVNRDQTITMAVAEAQVNVIIETNTTKEVVKVMDSDRLSEVEDVAITVEEVEDTVIVAVTTSKYLMILSTGRIIIVVTTTMNQVMLKTKVSASTRFTTEVEVVNVEDLQAVEEDIKPKNQQGAKVDMVTTSNIVDPIIKQEVEAEEHADRVLMTTR